MALAGAPFHAEPAIRPGQTLTVHDLSGRVRVRVGSHLVIDARKHAERSDPNTVAVKVETSADGVAVCVRYPPDTDRGCDQRSQGANDNDTEVDFDITVPAGVGVAAANVNGPVDVVAAGPARGTSVNGEVRIDAPHVDEATTVNGGVRVWERRRSSAPLRASSVNGRIEIDLPAGSGVTVSANTLNGDIRADGLAVTRSMYGLGAKANGVLGDGAQHLSLSSVNGAIVVRRG
ncbi:MAG TPA: hypothetical protein VMD91_14770 [Candidatus Sulfotelmatobacter sp.]|nr:hypothetical protein [Candidatus Sulfotelmatobacter sp.]